MEAERKTKHLDDERRTKLLGHEAPAAWLVPQRGKQAGQVFKLEMTNIVGADLRRCHVYLDEEHVSSTHAEVSWREESWVLKDLSSRNGTRVGGQKLGKGERFVGLKDGDVLTFGALEVIFKCV